MIGTAAAKPKRGTAKRQKAAGQRRQAKADKLVYRAVDARLKASGDADELGTDGRLCGVRVEQLNTGDVWQA